MRVILNMARRLRVDRDLQWLALWIAMVVTFAVLSHA